MKILLIDPPFKTFTGYSNNFFPIGLATLATILEKAGHEARVLEVDNIKKTIDIDFSDEYKRLQLYVDGINDDSHPIWEIIRRYLDEYKPDLIGMTIMTQKFGSAIKTAQVCKKWRKDVLIVVGGPHPTLDPEQTLTCEHIDFVVRGEGEQVILKLADHLSKKARIEDVPSLSYRKDGAVVHNKECPLIENLDTVPFPGRELLLNPDSYTSEDMGVIMTNRGCPFRCTYCLNIYERRTRFRSVENVFEEIRYVKEKYGAKQFAFKDDTFTINRSRLMALFDLMINKKIGINWECTTRVDVLDEDIVKAMIAAGCNVIKVGVESGSEKILRDTKKGITKEQIRKAARLLNKYSLFWSAYFMIGLPQETQEDILSTYKFMEELNPFYAGLGVYNPMPSTELFDEGVRMGLVLKNVGLDHFLKTNPKDLYFKDPKKRVAHIDQEKFEELALFMTKAFHKHNTKLFNLARRGWTRRRAYRSEPGLLVTDIRKAVKWVVNA